MTTVSDRSKTGFTVVALFGYEDGVRERIESFVRGQDDFVAIWCGGSETERFRLKQWWLEWFESDPSRKPATLYIAPDDDLSYVGELVSGLAERRPGRLNMVVMSSSCPKSFASKTAQKLKMRMLKTRVEKFGISVGS